MTSADDDEIETLLRKRFAGPVPDDGFTARVMQRVPVRRRRATWPVWTGLLAGAAACGWSLRDASLLQAGWHDWMTREPSAPAIALMLTAVTLSLLSALWGATEADDR